MISFLVRQLNVELPKMIMKLASPLMMIARIGTKLVIEMVGSYHMIISNAKINVIFQHLVIHSFIEKYKNVDLNAQDLILLTMDMNEIKL